MLERRKVLDDGTTQSAGPGRQSAKALVVDDDPGTLLLLQQTMDAAGFEVRAAASGEEAISCCEEFQPDLALLDINMPKMDGIEACEKIRQLCGQKFPIVMVTSVDDATSIQLAFEAGANDFIVKPINWPLFQRRMDSIMTEWNRASDLSENKRRLQALQRVTPEQVMLLSRNGVIIEDLKARNREGQRRRVAKYPTLDELYGARIASRFKQCISSVLKTCRTKTLQFKLTHLGIEREFEAEFQVDGRERVIAVVQTIDQPSPATREIYDLAFYDPVTTLPNAHLFRRFAKTACTESLLQSRSTALVSVGFESAGGHTLTDEALEQGAAGALSRCVAEIDGVLPVGDEGTAHFVARSRNDEFVLLLRDVSSNDQVAQAVATIMEEFVRLRDREGVSLTPVVGVAILPADGSDPDTLLRAARAARQEAILSGRANCLHSPPANMPELQALDYAAELQNAIDKGQLELHFQPRVAAHSQQITCVEALLRWNHPMRGYVGLGETLRLAKATGMMLDIGEWVMRSACDTAAGWSVDAVPRISINLSRQEMLREGLVGLLQSILDASGLDAGRLEVELTEAAMLRIAESPALLGNFKALGVGIVLDDFGTGHSSLASLRDFPVDGLKIDATFVSRAIENSADANICEIIVMMAHKMGLTAIAEGVESREQFDFLTAIGCDELQGFFISRPLAAADFEEYLAEIERPAK